jgi:tripartite-type tricarboxylate transporter receptor subunit TctC
MKLGKKLLSAAMAAGMLFSLAACGGEADVSAWPEENITLTVPASAGGGTDLTARIWAQYAAPKLGVDVIVNNVTGGGGVTATRSVKDAEPDGYNILYWHQSVIVNDVTGVADYGYDAFTMGPGFAYDAPTAVFVNADNPYGWKTLDDLIATAKEKPGEITVATEIGSTTYFMLLGMQRATGTEFAITDGGSNSEKVSGLLGKAFDVMINAYSTAGSYVESGDFLCLAVPTEERCTNFPDVPTFIEQGYDFTYEGYHYCMFLPKDTPQEILDKLDSVTEEICADPAVVEALANILHEPEYVSSADNAVRFAEMQEYFDSFDIG